MSSRLTFHDLPFTLKSDFIIAGTDTGIGKTYVGCLLAKQLHRSGKTVGVFKPFESGGNSDSKALQKASGTSQTLDEICFYKLKLPASPYQAAKAEKIKIDFSKTVQNIKKALSQNQVNIIELAGGLLVPITQNKTNLDLIKALKLPVILVAANKLGTINHSLMTLEILKKHKVKVSAFYLNTFKNSPPSKLVVSRITMAAKLSRHSENPKVLKSNLEQIKMFFPKIKYFQV